MFESKYSFFWWVGGPATEVWEERVEVSSGCACGRRFGDSECVLEALEAPHPVWLGPRGELPKPRLYTAGCRHSG